MTKDKLIAMMVSRFLGWKLPKDFSPDGGITFKQESDYEHPNFGRTKYEPMGTNLFHAAQAKEMFEYCLEGTQQSNQYALGYKAGLEAAVKELRLFTNAQWYADLIANMPVPDAQLRDLTDGDKQALSCRWDMGIEEIDEIIAKFKDKQL